MFIITAIEGKVKEVVWVLRKDGNIWLGEQGLFKERIDPIKYWSDE